MSTMIERVADRLQDVATISESGGMNFAEMASAAIEAMREPTDAMSRVLGDAAKYGTRSNGEVGPKELMSDLINAALEETL